MANGWLGNRYSASAAIERGKNSHFIYSFGGDDAGHKDCSAFVCYCYGIPRIGTASFYPSLSNYNFIWIPNTRNFQQGDIVFWIPGESGQEYGHTGIYLQGGGVMQMQGPDGRAGPQINGPNYPYWTKVFRPPEGGGIYIESFS